MEPFFAGAELPDDRIRRMADLDTLLSTFLLDRGASIGSPTLYALFPMASVFFALMCIDADIGYNIDFFWFNLVVPRTYLARDNVLMSE
jgi:hypothetical protein